MKKIAALLVFVMVFALAAPALAVYRTGSAAGDAAAYGAGGAVVGGGACAAVMWLFSVACPPAAIVSAAVVGGAYLGWYGATDSDKTLKKDVENTVAAGVWGTTAGLAAAELIEKGTEAALQAAY
ncbi:MAG: hypothetical protein IJG37_03460 [Synergistaceae bacterium]|nr:hypothetical protein [Synergistaceae bacterium]MBQ6971869.1 hypothetical protein [Synergistaceae bacterium]